MSETSSTMLPLGTKAPDFNLPDVVSGKMLSLNDIKSKNATVIMFLCNHCPYVKHIQDKLVETADHYQAKGIQFVAISSNDAETYPSDGPDKMKLEAQKNLYSFPYLYDETQSTAKAYHAACTPDFFVFDKDLRCVYRGRFDNATPGNAHPVTGKDLSDALDNLLVGKPISAIQHASLGCNIKWKKEPLRSQR